jgi:hypothetical protein
MKDGGEWHQKRQVSEGEGKSYFYVRFDSGNHRWAEKRGLFIDRAISFTGVIFRWMSKKFDNDDRKLSSWSKQTKIYIDDFAQAFRIDWR